MNLSRRVFAYLPATPTSYLASSFRKREKADGEGLSRCSRRARCEQWDGKLLLLSVTVPAKLRRELMTSPCDEAVSVRFHLGETFRACSVER
jgi:hypothetical protein